MVERKSLDSVAVACDGRGAKQGVVDSFLSSFGHSKKKGTGRSTRFGFLWVWGRTAEKARAVPTLR